jgi:hypothetical protein
MQLAKVEDADVERGTRIKYSSYYGYDKFKNNKAEQFPLKGRKFFRFSLSSGNRGQYLFYLVTALKEETCHKNRSGQVNNPDKLHSENSD